MPKPALLPGCDLAVFEDVVADPPSHVVEAAVALCREKQVEAVVSIGGGSALGYSEACRLSRPLR